MTTEIFIQNLWRKIVCYCTTRESRALFVRWYLVPGGHSYINSLVIIPVLQSIVLEHLDNCISATMVTNHASIITRTVRQVYQRYNEYLYLKEWVTTSPSREDFRLNN